MRLPMQRVKDSPVLTSSFSPNEAKGCHPQGWWFGCAFGKVFLGALFCWGAGTHGEKKTYGKDQKSDLGNHGIHHRGRDLSLECFQMKLRCWHSELEHLETWFVGSRGGTTRQPPISWCCSSCWRVLGGFFCGHACMRFNYIVWWVTKDSMQHSGW